MNINKEKKIKCIIWDLDNTLWQGVLLEDRKVVWNKKIINIIKILDQRGILHSIASKNDYNDAWTEIQKSPLFDFFLYPQIHWEPKSTSVTRIASALNIGVDTFAFVDDQPYELDEVASIHPEILCIPSWDVERLLTMPECQPRFVTEDSRQRRKMYIADIKRKEDETVFEEGQETFLATLRMQLHIARAEPNDMQRAEELTSRTNQLNTTGKTYSYDELIYFYNSPDHELLVVELTDKYGSYGKIGLVLLELSGRNCYVRLLLMSCRVMSRGIGTVMINYLRQQAEQQQWCLYADFVETKNNRMMNMTYRLNGFETDDASNLLKNNLENIPDMPAHIQITVPEKIFNKKHDVEEDL